MTWLYLVIIAQFLNALALLFDKFLVTRAVTKPIVYAFYITILSGVVLILLPFGVISYPNLRLIWLSLATGFSYVASLYFLYESLAISEASDVAPVMGGVAALSTFFFGYLILGGLLKEFALYGFVFLVLGTALMSYYRFTGRSFVNTLIAGILFGLSSVIIKSIFSQSSFIDGFFWSRLGNVVGGLSLLVWPICRSSLADDLEKKPIRNKFLIVGNKGLAGTAFLFLLGGIFLGNVSLVNALSGTQFIFILFLALIFTKKFPEYFHETVGHKHIAVSKILGTLLVVAGLALLFI